jgi:hypothetical protein
MSLYCLAVGATSYLPQACYYLPQAHLMALYCLAVSVILLGLYILCAGEMINRPTEDNEQNGEHNGLATHDGERQRVQQLSPRAHAESGIALAQDPGGEISADRPL